MRSFWLEPFLWIHLAGIALVPLFCQAVWLGLAIGQPLSPFWLELLLVGTIGIVPVFWMQYVRPFDIFSILILALKPEVLTPEQAKILSLFKRPSQRWLAWLTAVLMAGLLWQIYQWFPLAAIAVWGLPQWRLLGLLIASVAFFLSNLFIQVPISVLGVLLTSEEKFNSTEPLTPERISQEFTVPGFRVNKILPSFDI